MSISKILTQFTGPCLVAAAGSGLPQAGFERGGRER